MKKLLLIFISITLTAGLSAQQSGKLTVYGKVKYKNSILNTVQIELIKDNELIQEVENLRNGGFKIELPLGAVYNLTFIKDGFVTKSVAVVAKADSTVKVSGRYFFQLDIELFKEDDDEVDETMLPPVAKLYLKSESQGFTYDKKYVKWVAGKYEEELEE